MVNKQQEFIKNDYGDIIGVDGEKTIIKEEFNMPQPLGEISVLITLQPTDSNGEDYYNFYILDPHHRQEPLNLLNHQIPADLNHPRTFTKMFMEMQVIQYYLWFKYSTNEKVLSFGVEVEES